MDILSDILQMVKLSGSIWCRSEAHAPWGMKFDEMDLAHFHFMRRGNCVFHMAGMASPLQLSGGDLVFLPHGNAHMLADNIATEAIPISILLADCDNEGNHVLRIGNEGNTATMICGYCQFDRSIVHPLLTTLPDFIHIKGEDEKAGAWFETTLDWIARESGSGSPGSAIVIARLVEILFIQIIRIYVSQMSDEHRGWMKGLRDPQIYKALSLIHEKPEHPWTVYSLSSAVCMSRASFADRFKKHVGESPHQYLTRWRMYKATTYLKTPNSRLDEVAEKVGFQNQAAFSKVFKRYLGVPPGGFRRQATPQKMISPVQ